jgi:hypothetical protein
VSRDTPETARQQVSATGHLEKTTAVLDRPSRDGRLLRSLPPDLVPTSADHAPTLPAPPDRGERRGRLAPLLICGAQKTADAGAIGSGAEEKGAMRHADDVRYARY